MPKKKEKKAKVDKVVESFNNATKEQKEGFVNVLEKALNFNPKRSK